MVIGHHELHVPEASGAQALQKGRPEGPIFGVAHVYAQDLSVPGGRHAGHHHYGTRHHPALHPSLHVGGVAEQIGKAHVPEGSGAERFQVLVELSADPAHLGLRHPRGRPERLDQVVDLAGGHPVDIRLHDHGEQGPVDAPAPLQDGGEEAAPSELGDGQVHIPCLGGEHTSPMPVALGRAAIAALVRSGPDGFGRFHLDEGLKHELHRAADLVDIAAGTERVEKCIGVKISLGHRGDLLCRALLGTRRGSLRWSTTWWTPPNYTTSGDANLI